MRAHDADTGKSLFHFCLQRIGDPGRSAIKVVRILSILRRLHHGEHQVRPIHTLHAIAEFRSSRPHQRHAVARVEECAIEDPAEVFVFLRLGDSMHAGHADVALAPFGTCLEHGGGRDAQIHCAHRDAEDVELWDHSSTSNAQRPTFNFQFGCNSVGRKVRLTGMRRALLQRPARSISHAP